VHSGAANMKREMPLRGRIRARFRERFGVRFGVRFAANGILQVKFLFVFV
jgi:hypothetical protein